MSEAQAVTAPVQGIPAEIPKEEVKPTEDTPKVEPKKEDPKFAALAKRERMLMRERQQQRMYAQQLEQQKVQLTQREKFLDTAKTNPLEALKAMGWTYDQLTNFVLNDNKITPDRQIAEVKKEIETWKEQQARERQEAMQSAQQQAQNEAQEVLDSFKERVGNFLETKKDTYELVNLYQEQELVFALIEQHFNNTGKVMSIEEAARLAETDIEERIDQGLKTKKISTKYKVGENKPDEKKAAPKEPSTLNNNMNTGITPNGLPAATENDRIKRALAKLNGE